MKLVKLLIPLLNKLPDRLVILIGNFVIRALMRSYAQLTVEGRQVLEARIGKPTLYIANHLSNADGIILNQLLSANSVTFLAGVKLGDTALTAFFLKTVEHIPINPDTPDTHAIRAALQHLQTQGSVVIFPEGTRSRAGGLLKAKSGFLLLARMANVPIVPIALVGTERLLPINDANMGSERLSRAAVRVSVGEPFMLPDKQSFGPGVDWKEACSSFAMARIAEMLPEAYRGEYR